jgi:hypothetical protein
MQPSGMFCEYFFQFIGRIVAHSGSFNKVMRASGKPWFHLCTGNMI